MGRNNDFSNLSFNRNTNHFNTFKIGNHNKGKLVYDSNNSYIDNY